ncbi:Pyrrolo-quinoline quinone beta-propeller repeat-containing protein [Actinobacteria bacterium OV450]|nr:Pyrrolo-quinoline quinone beta-propeller repeat-containing protein [Actinobacteria bacterium OV450]
MSGLEDLASTVVQLMVAAATAAATGVGGAAAEQVGELVRTRLAGTSQGDAVATFDAAPQEPAAQAALHTALLTVMTADQPFAVQLTTMVPATGTVAAPHYFASAGGAVVQGTNNRLRGTFAGRDVINHIRQGDARTLAVLAVIVLILALAGYGGVQIIGGGNAPPSDAKSQTGAQPGTTGGQTGPKGTPPSAPATAAQPAVRWSLPNHPWVTAPVVSDGRIYYTSFAGEAGMKLLTIDAASGTVETTLSLNEFESPGALAVSDGRFYFVDGKGILHAGRGTQWLWHFPTGARNTGAMKAPTVANGTVYIGGWNNELHAVDAATGERLWKFTAKDRIVSSPAVDNGVVYAGSRDGNLYALDDRNGQELWHYAAGEPFHDSSPVVANGAVFIGGTQGTFFAVNIPGGTERWRFRVEGDVAWGTQIATDPIVLGDLVYFGSMNNTFYALNTSTAEKVWSVTTKDSIHDNPSTADGAIYFTSMDGKLHAVDTATGAERWTYTSEGEVVAGPAIGKDTVYIATDIRLSDTGHLIALQR